MFPTTTRADVLSVHRMAESVRAGLWMSVVYGRIVLVQARVAQRIERDSPKVGVGGSSPSAGATLPSPPHLPRTPEILKTARIATEAAAGCGQERAKARPFTSREGAVMSPTDKDRGCNVEVQIRATDTKVTEGMREFIDRRMAKLDKIADRVIDAQLELRTETPRSGPPITTAQITLKTGKHIIRAEEKADEPARAVDAAIDKLITQVRKFNEKRRSRRRRAGEHPMVEMASMEETFPLDGQVATAIAEPDLAEMDDDEEEDLPLRVKRFSIKPMTVDEAVDQMELLGHDFFLFQNADEDMMNVVYKRRDGAYGLLAPTKP